MNPMEHLGKKKEELIQETKELRAVERAKHEVVSDMLELLLTKMPEGRQRNEGTIIMVSGRIQECLDDLSAKAVSLDGERYTEQQAQQVADYLRCVHVGMREFMKQIGMEG